MKFDGTDKLAYDLGIFDCFGLPTPKGRKYLQGKNENWLKIKNKNRVVKYATIQNKS